MQWQAPILCTQNTSKCFSTTRRCGNLLLPTCPHSCLPMLLFHRLGLYMYHGLEEAWLYGQHTRSLWFTASSSACHSRILPLYSREGLVLQHQKRFSRKHGQPTTTMGLCSG